jgi:cell wall-associated NlpC family hydrolase
MNTEGLVGIQYKEARDDCWGLMIKFYELNFNLALPNYARPNLWWIKAPELDITRNHFQRAGFKIVEVQRRHLQPGDLILMNISTTVLDHVAAYIGGGKILHQPFRTPSRIDLYGGIWLDRTMLTARHPDVIQVDRRASLDLMDLVTPYKRDRYRAIYEETQRQRASGVSPQGRDSPGTT